MSKNQAVKPQSSSSPSSSPYGCTSSPSPVAAPVASPVECVVGSDVEMASTTCIVQQGTRGVVKEVLHSGAAVVAWEGGITMAYRMSDIRPASASASASQAPT